MAKKKQTKSVIVLQKAIDQPRRFKLESGKWVGIGGDIDIPESPPKIGYTVKEATKAEYLSIVNRCIYVQIKEA